MEQFTGISIKTRLYVLVLIAFIPVAVLITYVAEEQKAIETEAILHKALLLAETAANDENQQIEATRDLLMVVADAFLISDNPEADLSPMLARLHEQAKGYAAFGILAPNGRLIAASDPQMTGRVDFRNIPGFTACLENNALTMGPYHGEHIGGKPVLFFSLPVSDHNSKITAVAFAAVDLNWMNRAIFSQLTEMPEHSRLTLLDQTQGMLRYDTDTGQWSVPDDFKRSLQQQMIRRRSGTLKADGSDGTPRIYAFAPLPSSFRHPAVTVVLGIPEKIALEASRHIFTRNVFFLFLSIFIAMAAIWWASDHFLLKHIRTMVSAARKLSDGDLTARIGNIGTHDELTHLAGIIDEMSASLQSRIEREERIMESLKKSREQLRNLAAYQNDALEEERIRIARELHDRFGQSLTILKMDLSWLKKKMAEEPNLAYGKIASMSGVIDGALKDLHSVMSELRPVILDDFGLVAAIEWQLDEFKSHSGIDCDLECIGDEPDLRGDQATVLFRIFQEILTNVMRHSGADHIGVSLKTNEKELTLSVEDNGRGITRAEIDDPKSYGILGMRERLHPWNGHIAFQEGKDGGCRVTVLAPFSPKGSKGEVS